MKRILGLDIGTNSIGWALVEMDFDSKKGVLQGLGSRIIPMSQDELSNFDEGSPSTSSVAKRTAFRSIRKLIQRSNKRRERLHRVLNILNFLPEHYAKSIDFINHKGKFINDLEPKIAYEIDEDRKHNFIHKASYQEMIADFKSIGYQINIPYDWTLYYLRKKALYTSVKKEELAWIILNFNKKRGYYQQRGDEPENDAFKEEKLLELKIIDVKSSDSSNSKLTKYVVTLEDGHVYTKRSKLPIFSWKGETKKFIISKELDKEGKYKVKNDGSIKQTIHVVDPEKDWLAIKKKTEQDVEKSEKTLGEFIYDKLLENPMQKINGKLVSTIDRIHYKNEIKKILNVQSEYHPELRNAKIYQKCIEDLYPKNEGHRKTIIKKGFSDLIVDDILYYHRPLKSKKSTISECPYEFRTFKKGNKIQKQFLKCVPKSHPLFQEFRIWQFINNLKIIKKDEEYKQNKGDVTNTVLKTEDEYVELFEYLNNLKSINEKQILEFFVKRESLITKKNKNDYKWNYQSDKEYPCNSTRYDIHSKFSKINDNTSSIEYFRPEVELNLWHILYSVKDKTELKKSLKTFACKQNLPEEIFAKKFLEINAYPSEYGSYSLKALKKLLPLMRMGKYWSKNSIAEVSIDRAESIRTRLDSINCNMERVNEVADDFVGSSALKSFGSIKDSFLKGLPTHLACYLIYNRHSEIAIRTKWNSPIDIDKYLKYSFKQHQLRNPIVEKILTETLRTVRDLWSDYGEGKENFFDEIHVELGRSLKSTAKQRERISNSIEENQKTNERIRLLLEELASEGIESVRTYSPIHEEKLKLFEEGVYNQIIEKEKKKEFDEIRKKYSPSSKEIIKYKCWLEQGYKSPYTNKVIQLSKLFTSDYEIEHIIPKSRYLDNSLNNKVICERQINKKKGNLMAYEFIEKHQGKNVDLDFGKSVKILTLSEYKTHCKKYFAGNKWKLNNLLRNEIPESFISRQLNDNRYINKFAMTLLGNIVREENELESTPKRLIAVSGSITSILKNDWGLNDKWNELISDRFERLNRLTESESFAKFDQNINAYRLYVPQELRRGFNKKRIDHRHHALDALIIACTTKDHINYINSLNTLRHNYSLVKKLKNDNAYHHPWKGFPSQAKEKLETILVSFKQNQRVINRTNNKYWHWTDKKRLMSSKKKNFSIRKPLHVETFYGKISKNGSEKNKTFTASRVCISSINSIKKLRKITDISIQRILEKHLESYENSKDKFGQAFSEEGVRALNNKIVEYNSGKFHHPIYKVRAFEQGNKFPVGTKGNKKKKYVEAAKGTNLFFAVYWNERTQKRAYETISLKDVIDYQLKNTHYPIKDKNEFPINCQKGEFLFCLSPNSLIYVPTNSEILNPSIVDFDTLNSEQINRVYKVVSFSKSQCFFIKQEVARVIYDKKEFGPLNKMERDIDGEMIKDICWKINLNRLGHVKRVQYGCSKLGQKGY